MENTHEHLVARLRLRFAAYADLVSQIDADLLTASIDVPRHKTLAEHLWCVVGARESYARGISQGEWAGFACSMAQPTLEEFRNKLDESGETVLTAIQSVQEWTARRSELLTILAEHEVMHEGQIIRHMYAIDQHLPESWAWA